MAICISPRKNGRKCSSLDKTACPSYQEYAMFE